METSWTDRQTVFDSRTMKEIQKTVEEDKWELVSRSSQAKEAVASLKSDLNKILGGLLNTRRKARFAGDLVNLDKSPKTKL